MQRNYTYQLYIAFAVSLLCTVVAVVLQQPLLLAVPIIAVIGIAIVQHFNILWLALIASIAFSTETSITDSLSLDFPDEPLMMLITGIIILLIIAKKIVLPKLFWNNTIVLLLLAIFGWSVISASCSSYPLLSFKYCLAKLWFIIPFVLVPYLILQQTVTIRQLAITLIATVGITVLYVIYQHSTRGFLFDNINNAVVPFYRNHVNYSALVVCCLPVVYYLWKNATNIKHKRWLAAIALLFLFAIATSYSRGAWLALVVSIAAVWLLKKRLLAYGFIAILFCCAALINWLSTENRFMHYHGNYRTVIYHSNFKDHWTATFTGKDMSNAERFNRWIAGAYMVKENTITGYGPNTFYNNYKPFIVTPFKTWVSDNPEHSTVHNYFLLTLIEQGWVGLLLWVAFIFLLLRALENIYRQTKIKQHQHIALCTAAILCMVLTLNFLSDLIETDKIGAMFYLCVGVTVWLRVRVAGENSML